MLQKDIKRLNFEGNRNVNERAASKFLGLAVQTLRNMRTQRRGPPYAKFGKAVRYSIQDLLAWVEKKKIRPEDFP
jgi:hypothetical protein